MSVGELMRSEAEKYFASTDGQYLASKGRSSTLYPVHMVRTDPEVAVFHYHRFALGASDDHALAGWSAVMEGRRSAAALVGEEIEAARAAGRKAS